ncbi:MAG TPA: POTRA domain-containing protein, partial [Armatimonadota bacterium]|nr:POTRA domain-containing protein [Armatimonadota bacterium]
MRVGAERGTAEPQPGALTLRWLMLSALLAAVLTSVADAQKRPIVREIRIDIGPHGQISEEVVRSELTAVSVGMEYDQAKTAAALRAVLDTGYFQRDPKLSYVEAVPQGDDVALVFRLRENPIIESVTVEGNTVLDDATITALLREVLQPGRVLNSRMVDEWIQEAVSQAYRDRGYAAVVLSPTLSEQGVLTIAVVEQYIEDIRLAGLRKTAEKVVRREIEARPGQLVNTHRIQEDLDRLLALGIFEDV